MLKYQDSEKLEFKKKVIKELEDLLDFFEEEMRKNLVRYNNSYGTDDYRSGKTDAFEDAYACLEDRIGIIEEEDFE